MQTIFLVEDDPKIVCLLQAHLEKYGYTVATCTNFAQVLNDFKQIQLHSFYLILISHALMVSTGVVRYASSLHARFFSFQHAKVFWTKSWP